MRVLHPKVVFETIIYLSSVNHFSLKLQYPSQPFFRPTLDFSNCTQANDESLISMISSLGNHINEISRIGVYSWLLLHNLLINLDTGITDYPSRYYFQPSLLASNPPNRAFQLSGTSGQCVPVNKVARLTFSPANIDRPTAAPLPLRLAA